MLKRLFFFLFVFGNLSVCFSQEIYTGEAAYTITSYDEPRTAELAFYFGGDYYNIPETVEYNGDLYTVTRIASWAFASTYISELSFPNTITEIGDYAFSSCDNLYSMQLPDTITSLGTFCFDNCPSLTNASLPSSITSIPDGTFNNCPSLISAVIPQTVTSIGTQSFYSCQSLQYVQIPEGVTSIGYAAFLSCTDLHTVDIPSTITTIEELAFAYCTALTTVNCHKELPLSINSSVFEVINYQNATLSVPSAGFLSYTTAPVWTNFGSIITDTCFTPTAFNVTGGGTICGLGSSFQITLAGSQRFVQYYLKRNNAIIGQATKGTGFPLNLGTFNTPGTYTVEARRNNVECSNTMNGSAIIVAGAISPPPTATSTQNVCHGSTVANLVATGTNLKWYQNSSGGSPLSASTKLSFGTYYVTQTSLDCESSRVGVAVNIVGLPSKPAGLNTQVYSGNATLSSLSVTGTNVKWYASYNSTTVLPETTALIDGTTYYASQTSGLCESFYRLAVKVKKISENAVSICGSKTVSDLPATPSANHTVKWYATPSGGIALESSALLTSGTYYAEQTAPTSVQEVGSGFQLPVGIVADPSGAFYVANRNVGIIKRFNSNGTITQFTAPFSLPWGLALQTNGSLIVSEIGANKITRMASNGTNIETLVSNVSVTTVAVQYDGRIIYPFANEIRRINENGTGTTSLGSGFNSVTGLAVDNEGRILIAEFSNKIKRMNADGSNIVLLSNQLSIPRAMAVQPDGRILVVDSGDKTLKRLSADGTTIQILASGFIGPYGVSIDANGSILVADSDDHKIKRVTEAYTSNRVPVTISVNPTPTVPVGESSQIYTGSTTLGALNAVGNNVKWFNASTAGSELPSSTSVVSGTTYYAESSNGNCTSPTRLAVKVNAIGSDSRFFCNSATVENLTSTPAPGTNANWYTAATGGNALQYFDSLTTNTYYVEQEKPAVTSTLTTGFSVFAVAVQADGKLVIASRNLGQIRRANPDGSNVEIIASGFSNPSGVAIQADGKIVFTNSAANSILRMNADGTNAVTLASGFNNPTGITVDASGKIWFCDTYNHAVKRMNTDGTGITTIGSGFVNPRGITIDADGKILVGDDSQAKVKRMNPDGTNIESLGTGLGYPFGLAVRPNGKIIAADYGNQQVVQMNADGSDKKIIDTGIGYSSGVAITANDEIIVADYIANSLMKIIPPDSSNRVPISVTVTPSSENTTTINTCEPYTWSHNNQTYSNSGTFYGTTTNCVTQKLVLNITFPTVWDGTSWSDGAPDGARKAIFVGNYSEPADLSACSIEVIEGAVVIVPSGFNFTVDGKVSVEPGSSLTFQNNANLLQNKNVANEGNITSKRHAQIRRLDFVFWSAPVTDQNLLDFSPLTVTNRFYGMNESTSSFYSISNPMNQEFDLGKGYMIRAPNTFLNAPAAPQTFHGSFTGVPNNGNYQLTLTHDGLGYNFIGNPYPSPIDANQLLQDVTGTVYFWTHSVQTPGALNYASYNLMGGIASLAGGEIPNGIIQTGQGFLLKVSSPTTLHFSNSMRVADNQGQFYRTANNDKHRIWLNLSSGSTNMNQILVGYANGATNSFDDAFDGPLLKDGNALASAVDGIRLGIQAKSLPFQTTDVIPLSLTATEAANYRIAIDHVDGAFAEGQDVFIKDNLVNQTHNLSNSAYDFVSEIGEFNDRFELVFEAQNLGTDNNVQVNNAIIAYHSNDTVTIESQSEEITQVRIFDLRGREIYNSDHVSGQKHTAPILACNQMILVQVETANGLIATKKVVH